MLTFRDQLRNLYFCDTNHSVWLKKNKQKIMLINEQMCRVKILNHRRIKIYEENFNLIFLSIEKLVDIEYPVLH